jgi:hypothetical protein
LATGKASFGQCFLGIVPYNITNTNTNTNMNTAAAAAGQGQWAMSVVGLALHSVGRAAVVWLAFVHPVTVCMLAADTWAAGRCSYFLFISTVT